MYRLFLLGICLSLCLSPVQAQKDRFNPSADYIASHKGVWSFEVPEGQELMQVIFALTPTGIADSNLINHKESYYQDVMTHFLAYKDHAIVKKVERLLQKDHANYYFLNMDAAGFYFDGNARLTKDNTYTHLSWKKKNAVEPLLKLLQSFADETQFVAFYKQHAAYYDSLRQVMEVQVPIDIQWQWLEQNFPDRYDNYRILFSPLIWGSHSTQYFEAQDFRQTLMFVNGPISSSKYNAAVIEGLMTRVVFTEIDHNYVNPVSEKYQDRIDQIFSDRTKWTNNSESADWYDDPFKVFNEYMTWSVFSLYAKEHFNEVDFELINEKTEIQMTQQRGFPAFQEFNRRLLYLYQNKSESQTIADLMPQMLDWCAAYNQ